MLIDVGPLPDDPIGAAAAFHAEVAPRLLAQLAAGASQLTLVFAPAGHAHRAWREAAVQTLARECAPARINAVAVAARDARALAATASYIAEAPGLTGHYLPLDSQGAGGVIPSPA